jgi:hypothetical protein
MTTRRLRRVKDKLRLMAGEPHLLAAARRRRYLAAFGADR